MCYSTYKKLLKELLKEDPVLYCRLVEKYCSIQIMLKHCNF